ncbi:MAG: PTS sugar transporter subunit IIC [Gemmatimonadaceae bacterium]
MTLADSWPVILLGALIGLDTVSFPQAMLARPVVAATLGGLLVGDASLGLLCGAALECIALETLPVGASRYPEWGSASVVAGALFASSGSGSASTLLIAMTVALGAAWLGGWSMVQLRTLNARRVRANHERVARGDARVVFALQFGGVAADFVRGLLLSILTLLIGLPLQRLAATGWSPSLPATRSVVAVVAAAVALAAVWQHFSAAPHARWLVLGALAAGLTLMIAT